MREKTQRRKKETTPRERLREAVERERKRNHERKLDGWGYLRKRDRRSQGIRE